MIVRKKYLDMLTQALLETQLVLIYGARQVGKTTLMKSIMQGYTQAVYINCEVLPPTTTLEQLKQYIQLEYGFFLHEIELLCLDEIQVLDNAELLLKILYDDDRITTKIIATGSRFRGQKKVGSTLVGRGKIVYVTTFDFEEFMLSKGKFLPKNPDFLLIQEDLKEYMTYGGYPAVVVAKSHEQKVGALRDIIERMYDKDFVYYINQKLLFDFKKMFQALVLNISSLFKMEGLGGQISVSKNYIEKFYHFLSDSFLIYTITPYYSNKAKEYSQRPKLYMHDLGVINYVRGTWNIGFDDGLLNENFVIIQCMQHRDEFDSLHFYKKISGAEVDVVVRDLYGNLLPIEVKSNDKQSLPPALEGFCVEYKVKKAIKTSRTIYTQEEKNDITYIQRPYWNVWEN